MVEELSKNMPEYLMHTNSSINKDDLKSANEIFRDFQKEASQSSVNYAIDMPRILKEPLNPGSRP
jgi:hypothetical protein